MQIAFFGFYSPALHCIFEMTNLHLMTLSALRQWLFREVDNSPLIFFRLVFGFLCFAEASGAILTGWVHETFVEPDFTFTFIGFEFLHILNGPHMYVYFSIMALMGICIMLGFLYHWTTLVYFLMWSGVYFAQKSHYNNHYYLLVLLLAVMAVVPAARAFSLDAKLGILKKKLTCPNWAIQIFIIQLAIVYTYAAFSKIYPDWLEANPIRIWFSFKRNYWLVGEFLQQEWVHYMVAYGGILFDLLIIPALIWRKTRIYAFTITFFFHLFNSFVFQIGIFPYLMLGMNALFFPPDTVRRVIFRLRQKAEELPAPPQLNTWQRVGVIAFSIYFAFQILLPLRYHLFDSNVHWSEEGHRLSWKMMLRAKSGRIGYIVEHPDTGEQERVATSHHVSRNQRGKVAVRPDMIWQLAQHIDSVYARKWQTDPKVFAEVKASLNGHPYQTLIDPNRDLSALDWERWTTADWILPWDPDTVAPPPASPEPKQ